MNQRRKFTPREKLEIVLEGMASDASVAAVCRARGVSTTQYYAWRDALFKNADAVYGRKRNDRTACEVETLRAELARKDRVIAGITAENLELKKTPGAWKSIPGYERR